MRAVSESLRILHVGASRESAARTAEALETADEGLEVLTGTGTAAALDSLEETGVDCVVADRDRPEGSGVDLLGRVRQRHPELPAVLLTEGDPETVVGAAAAGVTDSVRRDEPERVAGRMRDAVAAPGPRRSAPGVVEQLVVLFDADGTLRKWNDWTIRATGHESATLRSRTVPELFAEDDRAAVDEALDRLRETGHVTHAARLSTAAGRRIPYEIRASRVSTGGDDDRTAFVLVGRDVSDRDHRERSLNRLHDVTRELLRVESDDAVAAVVVGAVRDVLGYPIWGSDCSTTPEPGSSRSR